MKPVSVTAAGMVTGVGLSGGSSCAAIRCAIDNFTETRFMDAGGEWIIGSSVPLPQPWRGIAKLTQMAASAIGECLTAARGVDPSRIPLLLCIAEKERPGRFHDLDERLPREIAAALETKFHPLSAVIARGRIGGALAMEQASRLIHEERVPCCIVAGADSLLVEETLRSFQSRRRLLTSDNSNGFIPGEAGTAVLITPTDLRAGGQELCCIGFGQGSESATVDSEDPLRGDGLLQAMKAAFAGCGCVVNDLDYRITDSNGEQYWFKEATLALDRYLAKRKELFEIWHPADCIGDVGAAIGPCAFGLAMQAARRGYAFGRGPLCHFSAEDSTRVALVFNSGTGRSN